LTNSTESGYAKHMRKVAISKNKTVLFDEASKIHQKRIADSRKILDVERENHIKRMLGIASKHTQIAKDLACDYVKEIKNIEDKIRALKSQINEQNEKIRELTRKQQAISDSECHLEADKFDKFHENLISKLQSDFDNDLKKLFDGE